MKLKAFLILFILLVLKTINSNGQGGNPGNNRAPLGALPLGWASGTAGDLDIRNDFTNQQINFLTNSVQSMVIMGPIGGMPGFVGIGTTTPTRQLNVVDDIDLTPGTFPNSGYRWQDSVILKTNNTTENIFLRCNAGINAGGGSANTFLGSYSGERHNSNSGGNTFVGWNSGSKGTNASESV